MVKFARQNCKQNGLDIESGGQISVVAGRIEDLDPPSQKASFIKFLNDISLLHEISKAGDYSPYR